MTFGCDETRRWVDPWIDQELDPSAALHIEAHMARCADCRVEAEVLRDLKRALGALREESAPTAVRLRVFAALDAEDDAHEQELASARKRKHALGFVLTGAALAGVVLASGHRARSPYAEGDAAPALASLLPVLEEVTTRHARELPAEVSASDPAQVSQWFRGKLDIPIRPVLFRGMSARLVGARISNVRDEMAAALYYDIGGRRLTVFVFDGALMPRTGCTHEVVGNRDFYVASAHGYTVTFTERQGVGYAVASDLPPQESVQFVANAELR